MASNFAHASADGVWVNHLYEIISTGTLTAPRGSEVIEILGARTRIAADNPVITHPQRHMGYRFMAAEAAWILSGDDRVETIRPYSKAIARYSDDGELFFGAYGPRLVGQWEYAKEKLMRDADTRQAVIDIWRPNPPETRDVPCTLGYQFFIRNGRLDLFANMRSSDAWLGWTYDVFAQSMILAAMTGELRYQRYPQLELGDVHLYMSNAHLYQTNWENALRVMTWNAPKSPLIIRPLDVAEFTSPTGREELARHLWMVASKDTTATELTYRWLKELKIFLDQASTTT